MSILPTQNPSPVSSIQTTPESRPSISPQRSNRPLHATGCGRCDAWWTGLNTSHCSACHQTFTGLSAFDRHRDGNHAAGTRHCVYTADVGLVDAGRPYPCFALPGSNNHWAKTAQPQESPPEGNAVWPGTPGTYCGRGPCCLGDGHDGRCEL